MRRRRHRLRASSRLPVLAACGFMVVSAILSAAPATAGQFLPDEFARVDDKQCPRTDRAVAHAREIRGAVGLRSSLAVTEDSFADPSYYCTAFGVPLSDDEAQEFIAVLNAQAELSDKVSTLEDDPTYAGAYLDGATLVVSSTNGTLGSGIEHRHGFIETPRVSNSWAELQKTADTIVAGLRRAEKADVDINLVTIDPRFGDRLLHLESAAVLDHSGLRSVGRPTMHHDGLSAHMINPRRRFRHRRRWATAIIITLVLSGCAMIPMHSLGDRLPRSAAGVSFGSLVAVDNGYLSGHAIDDVLVKLGKTRDDAVAYFRTASGTEEVVGAVRVDGIDGATLLQAVADSWMSAATVARSETTIGDRIATVLETRDGSITVAYQRDDIVYLVTGRDPALVDRIVAEGMP